MPRLLDHFGIAMYNTIPKAIAELCANAYDADATRVDIKYSADEISIRDNGRGTPADVEDRTTSSSVATAARTETEAAGDDEVWPTGHRQQGHWQASGVRCRPDDDRPHMARRDGDDSDAQP